MHVCLLLSAPFFFFFDTFALDVYGIKWLDCYFSCSYISSCDYWVWFVKFTLRYSDKRPFIHKYFFAAGASRSSSTTPKSSTPTSRPSSAKKIPASVSTPAKGEKELEAQVTHLTEQVCLCTAQLWAFFKMLIFYKPFSCKRLVGR